MFLNKISNVFLPWSKCNGANKINFNISAIGSERRLGIPYEATCAPSFIGRPHNDAHVLQTGRSIKTRTWIART